MKKALKWVLALFVVIIGAVLVTPFLIPPEVYKREITRAIYERTGRQVEISGEVKASVYPVLGARLEGVTLSNGEGFSSQPMLTLKEMVVEVALQPLLKKEVQVQRFILEEPVISLEVNKQGKPNWEFKPVTTPLKDAAKAAYNAPLKLVGDAYAQEAEEPAEGDISEVLEKLQIGELQINNGTVHFANAQTGMRQSASDVNVKFGLKNLDDPFALVGSAVWSGEKISVDAKLDNPRAILAKQPADVVAKLNTKHAELDFTGKATAARVQGALKVNSPSLLKLAHWATGKPVAWKGPGALAFDTKGQLQCSTTACDLKQATIQLDSLQLAGDVGAQFGGAVPAIKANLSTPLLDVNTLVEPAKTAALLEIIASAYAAPAAGWSNDPIDLSGLRAMDVNAKISTDAVKFNQLSLGKTVLNTVIKQGTLALDIMEMSLYQGHASGRIGATASNAISADIKAQGINAEALLKAIAGDDRLSGTLALDMDVKTSGGSQRAMVSNLGGKGKVLFTDGALKGINIPEMVRNAKSALGGQQTAQAENTAQKTDFAELGGSFTIANGVINNQDLSMKAPVLRLGGKGTVDLPNMTVNYRLLPTLVASLKGQGGKDKEGLTVPIIVEGPLTAPRYRPDVAGLVEDALKNPEKTKETINAAKDIIKNIKKDPDGLKNLLKGFGG